MKSALLLVMSACFLSGVPPSFAAHLHPLHNAHPRGHRRTHIDAFPGVHLQSATHLHRAHSRIKHARYAMRTRVHLAPANQPASLPRSEAPVVNARAITALPLPPEGTPEFGGATASTQAASTQPASYAAAAITPGAEAQPQKPVVQQPTPAAAAVVLSAAIEPPPPPIAPAETHVVMTTPEPEVLPAPMVPSVGLNQPFAVPLPEPSTFVPDVETAPVIVPEHEDDDQPIAATSGNSYIGLARVNHTRPFPELKPMHGYDLAVSGTGVFNHMVGASGIQSADPTPGLFLAFHHSTGRWWDLEAHYGLNRTSTAFSATTTQLAPTVPVLSQEFSADLLVRRHLNRARPYQMLPDLGVGGGILFLHPATSFSSQVAPTFLLDSGVDIPTNNQHISFRIGSHLLLYRSPAFSDAVAASFAISAQPAAGMLFHF